MKYLSMIELLRIYISHVKENRILAFLDNGNVMQSITIMDDFRPFVIAVDTESEEGQTFNELSSVYSIRNNTTGLETNLTAFKIPQILEVEWLKSELQLSDEATEAFTQIGYAIMVIALSKICNTAPETWGNYMERNGIIKEVEDLADTAEILKKDPLPTMALPKVRQWTNFLACGNDFDSMFHICREQSNTLKMLYIHLPLLTALFMMDYSTTKLNTWEKSSRLTVENQLKQEINVIENFNPNVKETYTYAMSSSVTVKDKELLLLIFTSIYNKLHELNSDIGLITFSAYENIKSDGATKASVRLCNMGINWQEEIDRAKQEKDAEADQTEPEKDEDEDEIDDDE